MLVFVTLLHLFTSTFPPKSVEGVKPIFALMPALMHCWSCLSVSSARETHIKRRPFVTSPTTEKQILFLTLRLGPTSVFDGVLVENVDQLVLATGLSAPGEVGSVVLQEGKIDALVVRQGQRLNMRQELPCHLDLEGAHPVGAELHPALHPHEALVLNVHRRCVVKTRTLRQR